MQIEHQLIYFRKGTLYIKPVLQVKSLSIQKIKIHNILCSLNVCIVKKYILYSVVTLRNFMIANKIIKLRCVITMFKIYLMLQVIQKLRSNQVCGPDQVSANLLKLAKEAIVPSLLITHFLNQA